MRIEASNRVVDDDGTVLVDSFWRHDYLVYIALREAGLMHEQAAHQIKSKCQGGGPLPQLFVADEIKLMGDRGRDEQVAEATFIHGMPDMAEGAR